VKVTTDFHPVPRLEIDGAIPPLPYTSSWRGAEVINPRDNYYPSMDISGDMGFFPESWLVGFTKSNETICPA
jgi:hypothetical protein